MSSQPSIPTPATPEYFDYTRAAREAGISDADLRSLIRIFEGDYPDDLMLRELHVLRACNAVARGMVTIREVLNPPNSQAA
ncbi:MAG: hypothetical protein KF699_03865 [Phycisphaeraceae bacterium]|nr:hypothetical protein [Phycisphaeraceae bacterium]MBX3405646.1 hypothetical protein [Phycisphaeraceae bacterium]